MPKIIGVKNSHNECNENSSSSVVEGNIAKRMKKSKSNIKKKRCSDISNNHHRLEDSLNIPALLMEEPKMKKKVSKTRGVKRILRTNDDTKLVTSNIKVASRKRIQQINVTSTMVGSENKTNFSDKNVIDDANNNENNERITDEHSNISMDNKTKSMLSKTYIDESSDDNKTNIVNGRINERVTAINILRDGKTTIANLSKDKEVAALDKTKNFNDEGQRRRKYPQ